MPLSSLQNHPKQKLDTLFRQVIGLKSDSKLKPSPIWLGRTTIRGINSAALYCCIFNSEDQRDEKTWSIHLVDAKEQGLPPSICVSDQASGSELAHENLF